MTLQQAQDSIGLQFIIMGLGLSRFDTIRSVSNDGTIEGDFYIASCSDCRIKQEQPEHLRKAYLDKKETVDLFEHPDLIPANISAIIEKYCTGDEPSYQELADMLKECEANGYTFEYYLDATPFNLKPLTHNNQTTLL